MASDNNRLAAVEASDVLERHLEASSLGEYDGFGTSDEVFEVFLYADDVDALLDHIRPLLVAQRLPEGSTAEKRYGPPGAPGVTLGGPDFAIEVSRNVGSAGSAVHYELGDWVAVPTHDGRYAMSRVVARGKYGTIVLAVMAPGFIEIPSRPSGEDTGLELVSHCICGDEGIVDGAWPVLGGANDFVEDEWPLPEFESAASRNNRLTVVDREARTRRTRKITPDEAGIRPSAGIRNQFGMEAQAGRLLDAYEGRGR